MTQTTATTAIVPLAIHPIGHKVYVRSNYPKIKAQNSIDSYRNEPANYGQAQIVKIVHLTREDYQRFLCSLLTPHDWLAGEGGSSYENELSLVVTNDWDYVLVNPEKQGYAYRVGLEVNTALRYILAVSKVKLIDWLNLYEEWIDTLVSQGDYQEIKSYEDWFIVEREKKRNEPAKL